MRVLVSAVVIDDAERRLKSVEIGVIERAADLAPASGLGLFLGESHELLRQLQALMLKTQVEQFLQVASRCASCGAHRAVKDAKTIVYRTAFGKAELSSPRLYARCSTCGQSIGATATFSPLAQALPGRTHPQWSWLQSRCCASQLVLVAFTVPARSLGGRGKTLTTRTPA